MSDQTKNNVERLLKHLETDSLAARLVQARQAPPDGDATKAMQAITKERFEKTRAELDDSED